MIKTINVITIESGIISELKAYPIEHQQLAECYFVGQVNHHEEAFDLDDAEECNFDYENNNGLNIVLIESI